MFFRTYASATVIFAAVMFLTGLAALAVVPTLPTAARELDAVSHFPLVACRFVAASLLGGLLGGHWADRASGAMQTTQNLGQVTVLGVASALFTACLGAGTTDAIGYGAAFGLLLGPCVLATVLATRARST